MSKQKSCPVCEGMGIPQGKNGTVKDCDCKLLIRFLDWLNKASAEEPMKFETVNDDIAWMFLEQD